VGNSSLRVHSHERVRASGLSGWSTLREHCTNEGRIGRGPNYMRVVMTFCEVQGGTR
jgi:hypothetical protein